MLNRINNRQGFTLIELLIVVAIIGILAAIAIPQFSAYRIRGYNSAATADIRNSRTNMEAFFSDWQVYPSSAAAGAPGDGALYITTTGALAITAGSITTTAPSADTSIQFPVSNNVGLVVSTDANGGTYTMVTKNSAGDRCYGADADATQLYWVNGEVGAILVAGAEHTPVGATNDFMPNATPDVASTAPCAGGVQVNWATIN